MASLFLTTRALDDLERLARFLAESDPPAADRTVGLILDALQVLEPHPLIGRPVETGRRELVISRGRSGYIALYRYVPARDRVYVLAIRHQRDVGFEED